jgi:hypothetical protein
MMSIEIAEHAISIESMKVNSAGRSPAGRARWGDETAMSPIAPGESINAGYGPPAEHSQNGHRSYTSGNVTASRLTPSSKHP